MRGKQPFNINQEPLPNSLLMDAWRAFFTKSFCSYLNSISSYYPIKDTNRLLLPSVRKVTVVYASITNIPLGEILANSWFWKYLFLFAFPKWNILRHVLWKRSNLNPYLEIHYRLHRLNQYFLYCTFLQCNSEPIFVLKKFDWLCAY